MFKQSKDPGIALQKFQARATQIAQQTGIELPVSYYRYAPCRCWKCNKTILVFTWPGQALHSEKPPNKQPLPKTIRYEFSKTIESKYWVNTCPYCQAIQGDFFLHCEPDGPFFGFSCGPDTPQAFQQDLIRIARHVNYR